MFSGEAVIAKPGRITIHIERERITVRDRGAGRRILTRYSTRKAECKPVLKWAGGKQWLAPIAPHLAPPGFVGKYFEPFAGAAAFFFALEPARAVLADLNPELITTYKALKKDVDNVIRRLKGLEYEEKTFFRVRARKPKSPIGKAARMIYLNRTCWNGLYRVNLKGEFNVPFGRYNNPTICDREGLRSAAELLQRSQLRTADFEHAVRTASKGDFVYLDPPYITGHQNNGFHKYNSRLFSWEDQERLGVVAGELADRGCHVLISNADHKDVLKQYPGFFIYKVVRNSLIGGLAATRGCVSEALISSYPLFGIAAEVL